jgi:hypothetical protein
MEALGGSVPQDLPDNSEAGILSSCRLGIPKQRRNFGTIRPRKADI